MKNEELTLDDRRTMAGVMMRDCRMAGEKVSLLVATEKVAEGVVRSIEAGTPAFLAVPEFVAA